MYGEIIGDIIGSSYMYKNKTKDYNFDLLTTRTQFSGNTIMIVATIDALNTTEKPNFSEKYKKWGRKYPKTNFEKNFKNWICSNDSVGIKSFNSIAAVRAIPIGWKLDTLEDVLQMAKNSAIVSHNHPAGIIGAKTVAGLVFLAKHGCDKQDLELWAENFYDLDFSLKELSHNFTFSSSCQTNVKAAIVSFLESRDFESAIRKAVSLGGDSKTIACISGALADAYSNNHPEYKIPNEFKNILTTYIKDEEMKKILKI